MSTIRSRLTMAYAAALAGTMLAFAVALWAARRAGTYEELHRYATTEANLALNVIRQAEEAGQPVTVLRDSIIGPVITPTLRTLLEGMPDYVLVLDSSGRSLYLSFAVRQLNVDYRAALQAAAITVPPTGVAQIVRVGGDELLLVARSPGSTESAVSRVVVAASMRSAQLALRELVGTSLIIAPILLLASLGLAYVIAGRALQPIDVVINEVQAITDGRSLHRRLPVVHSGDEIARLTVTLNEMIERLEKSFGALRRFTADASHELKTPLTVLRADVERAMNSTTAKSERLVALEEALQETTRMADLVDSLLTLARADEGRFDLHREPVELEPLAREVFETAAILGEAAGVSVHMPAVEPVSVMGDHMRLRQLFMNLVTNALKYTPRGGSVEIMLSRFEKTAVFSVRDTGIGISAADLPHVFERFYRADRARSRSAERGGFGLGLAISQWIAEAHGGTISVRSRLTRGSTFTVTLPLLDAAPIPAPQAAEEHAGA
ncbi:MAG TPA: HAMP domain-containing sensor histidine kinase [Gemmatimonadaceae bacterium]|nr:HAMP domain-containing sensor histidine kinase [Gemmatimonadaceae bacterium]